MHLYAHHHESCRLSGIGQIIGALQVLTRAGTFGSAGNAFVWATGANRGERSKEGVPVAACLLEELVLEVLAPEGLPRHHARGHIGLVRPLHRRLLRKYLVHLVHTSARNNIGLLAHLKAAMPCIFTVAKSNAYYCRSLQGHPICPLAYFECI